MLKVLADRLAEAFAEHLHERVRKEFWCYTTDENLSRQDLIKEKISGIRPAAGYPAQPDHTEKIYTLKLLDVEKIQVLRLQNIWLCFNCCCQGIVFAHPESHYFAVGKFSVIRWRIMQSVNQ